MNLQPDDVFTGKIRGKTVISQTPLTNLGILRLVASRGETEQTLRKFTAKLNNKGLLVKSALIKRHYDVAFLVKSVSLWPRRCKILFLLFKASRLPAAVELIASTDFTILSNCIKENNILMENVSFLRSSKL